jgi:hypothetical protein
MKIFKVFIISSLLILFYNHSKAQWSELIGTNDFYFGGGEIKTISTDAKGNIYAGGSFTNSFSGYHFIAKWNGKFWSELGKNPNQFNYNIYEICPDKSGNIYAIGGFTNSLNHEFVAKWNGANWSSLGDNSDFNQRDGLNIITTDTNGNIYVVGGSGRIFKWNGANWSPFGPIAGKVYFLAINKTGHVYASGDFKNNSGYYFLAQWNGINWDEVGGNDSSKFNSSFLTYIDSKGNIYSAEVYANSDAPNGFSSKVMKWDGVNWVKIGNFNGEIYTLTCDIKGNLLVSGKIYNKEGNVYVAKWDGINWNELGNNSSFFNNSITKLITDSVGNIYAIGRFTNTKYFQFVAIYKNN